jgi:hypothetical protein
MICIDVLLDVIIATDTHQRWNQYVTLIHVAIISSTALFIRDCQLSKHHIGQ